MRLCYTVAAIPFNISDCIKLLLLMLQIRNTAWSYCTVLKLLELM